jgi:hypothetical protein
MEYVYEPEQPQEDLFASCFATGLQCNFGGIACPTKFHCPTVG